jgi:hypothetical protein
MTNLLHKKNCHLDRSVAEWRDLRFPFGFTYCDEIVASYSW